MAPWVAAQQNRRERSQLLIPMVMQDYIILCQQGSPREGEREKVAFKFYLYICSCTKGRRAKAASVQSQPTQGAVLLNKGDWRNHGVCLKMLPCRHSQGREPTGQHLLIFPLLEKEDDLPERGGRLATSSSRMVVAASPPTSRGMGNPGGWLPQAGTSCS